MTPRPLHRALKIAGLTLGLLVASLAGFLGWSFSHLPKRGADRVSAAEGVVGVFDGSSYAWIIRTPHGAALIDAGLDPDAEAVIAELKRQGLDASSVHTILLTHGHADHFGGALAFPKATAWIGAADVPLALGHRGPTAFGPKLFGMLGTRKAPATLERLADGQVVVADETSIQAVAVPGHTPGSMMFVYRGVLFSGDSLFGGDKGVALCPDLFQEDAAENRRSLSRLAPIEFHRMADGHTGVVDDARTKLAAFLR